MECPESWGRREEWLEEVRMHRHGWKNEKNKLSGNGCDYTAWVWKGRAKWVTLWDKHLKFEAWRYIQSC